MTTRPLTLTAPDRALLGQILSSRAPAGDEARTLADLVVGMSESVTVPSAEVPRSVVTLNSRVRVRPLGADAAREFTLVVPGQADVQRGRLSVLTPVGGALLGRREGDVVTCEAPAGRVHYKIEAVLYQPEADGAGAVAA